VIVEMEEVGSRRNPVFFREESKKEAREREEETLFKPAKKMDIYQHG
jgi:hypothetical protein